MRFRHITLCFVLKQPIYMKPYFQRQSYTRIIAENENLILQILFNYWDRHKHIQESSYSVNVMRKQPLVMIILNCMDLIHIK